MNMKGSKAFRERKCPKCGFGGARLNINGGKGKTVQPYHEYSCSKCKNLFWIKNKSFNAMGEWICY